MVFLVGNVVHLSASPGVEPAAEGLLARRARMEAAVRAIPFPHLGEDTSLAIREVIDNPSYFRHTPTKALNCDPQLLTFMVRHPEVMVNIWELLGISNITAYRTGGNTFFADDGAGTKCNCELIHSVDGLHIYYGTGIYEGFLAPRPVKGRVVCLLRSEAQPAPQTHSGQVVHGTMDLFLKLDNLGADLLTRTLGPLVGKVTDHNFNESTRFVCQLSEICALNPEVAQSIAGQLTVADESIRRDFVQVTSRITRQQPPWRFNQTSSTLLPAAAEPAIALQPSVSQLRLTTLPELAVPIETSARPDEPTAESTRPWQPAAAEPSSQFSSRTSAGQNRVGTGPTPSAIAPRKESVLMRR